MSRAWAQGKLTHIAPYLPESGTILDIGSGTGMVSAMLREQGYRVTSLDVRDRSINASLRPVLYDGDRVPFDNDSFDCALLLTVLHHTPDPEAVLREALRVSPRVIVIEDVYSNPVQKQLTYCTDSLFNLEFSGHPHSNRTDREWLRTFSDLDVRVVGQSGRPVLLFYRQVAYSVVRRDG